MRAASSANSLWAAASSRSRRSSTSPAHQASSSHTVLRRLRGRNLFSRLVLQEGVQLVQIEPGEHQVEVQALESLEFPREKVLVPAGVECESVVGNDVCALLGFREMRKLDHRDGGHPEFAGRQEPAVPRDDP